MGERLPLVGLAGALLVGVLTVLVLRSSARGEFAEPSSTYRSEPDGARALFLLAQEAHLPVSRRHVDLETLRGTPELLLLEVEGPPVEKGSLRGLLPAESRVSSFEVEALLAAVSRGATAVVTVNRTGPLLSALGLELAPLPAKVTGPRRLVPYSPTAFTRGVASLDVPLAGTLRPATSATPAPDGGTATPKTSQVPVNVQDAAPGQDLAWALPVLVDVQDGDLPVALLLHRGQGRILVLSAPALASNAQLGRGDVARLWLNVLGALQPADGAKIAFDEFHHGFTGERSVMGYAARYGLPWAIVQGLFALTLWLWAKRRLGGVRPVDEAGLREGTDALLAMARIYQLGGHRAHAAQALVRATVRALQAHAGRGTQATVEAVCAALTRKGAPETAEALRALDAAAADPALDEPGLLALSQRAARLRATAQAPKHTDVPAPGKEAA